MSVASNQLQDLLDELPGLDCGLCGFRSCEEFARLVAQQPEALKRCPNVAPRQRQARPPCRPEVGRPACNACGLVERTEATEWKDSLGREYDFVLDTFPNEPGPRETILPHNPQLTRELAVAVGDILIGRPLGMSCGCPITHCGVATDVDTRTGVIVWCVTGPLGPRAKGYKDLGYYSAEAYEGLVKDSRHELKIGMRYWFLPRRCMLQWRHSGLINFINQTKDGCQIRIEGLLIG